MPSVFQEERLYTHACCHRDGYCNSDTDSHRNCHADINPNCHGNCESDSNTQTNADSETPCDTETAADSAAKAGRSVSNSSKCSGERKQPACASLRLAGMGRLKFQTDCDVEDVAGRAAGNYRLGACAPQSGRLNMVLIELTTAWTSA